MPSKLGERIDGLHNSVSWEALLNNIYHHTFGNPQIAAALIRDSLNFRAILSCSEWSGLTVELPAPFSIAWSKTVGISAAKLSALSVTPATKYQHPLGKCGCPRMEDSKAGVTIPGGGIAHLVRSSVKKKSDSHQLALHWKEWKRMLH